MRDHMRTTRAQLLDATTNLPDDLES